MIKSQAILALADRQRVTPEVYKFITGIGESTTLAKAIPNNGSPQSFGEFI